MLPFKRILWPTDFSEASYEALEAAKELASQFAAELILVHVVHPIAVVPSLSPGDFDVPVYLRGVEGQALNALHEIVENKLSGQIKARTGVLIGKGAHAIVDAAAKENADLIVIAIHGETEWRKFVLGSVAEKVVRLASCPVLTIQSTCSES